MKNKDGNDNGGSHPDGIFFILYFGKAVILHSERSDYSSFFILLESRFQASNHSRVET